MNIKESIDATKKGFEESFSSGEFYNRQTQDVGHLEQILDFLPITERMRILDLGTDPCPNECDETRFVDEYMQLKKDGHINFIQRKNGGSFAEMPGCT